MSAAIHPMYINGEWRPGSDGGLADDVNPATGEVFARVAQASVQDVEDAIAAAHGSRLAWQKMLANEREALLHRTDAVVLSKVRKQVLDLCEAFPLYAERRAKAQAEVRA